MTVANRLGNPIATNRKPTRTITAATTSRDTRDNVCGRAASAKNKMPSGHRNQPDLPKSVYQSKAEISQRGSVLAASIAAASIKIKTNTKTATVAAATKASLRGASHGCRG